MSEQHKIGLLKPVYWANETTQIYYNSFGVLIRLMSILEESLQHQIENNPENKEVSIYLRLPNSKSVKITQPTEQSVASIKKKVTELMGIQTQSQILYYRGKELIKDKMLTLANGAIIHVKNAEEVMERITVRFITHLPQNQNIFKLSSSSVPVSVQPTQTIYSLINQLLKHTSEEIDIKRTKIIECGRFLSLKKTFLQEKIQSQTEVHLILRKPKNERAAENEEENRIFIESVLKSSRQNSITDRQAKIVDQKLNSDKEEVGQGCRYHNKAASRLRKSETFYHHIEQSRQSLPNYYTPTKSSEYWQSQKVIKKELTPLKFSFREYKRYEGPKSLRECNCKRKDEFYIGNEGQINIQGDSSPKESNSPLSSKIIGLKKINSKVSIC